MIVIADTGPLNYLVLIGSIDVLKPLYTRVVAPQAVVQELEDPAAPAAVRAWITQPPAWLEVRPNPTADPALDFLGAGERAALTLAASLNRCSSTSAPPAPKQSAVICTSWAPSASSPTDSSRDPWISIGRPRGSVAPTSGFIPMSSVRSVAGFPP